MLKASDSLHRKILHANVHENFESIALEIFRFQTTNSKVYAEYVQALGINLLDVKKINQIPFLPIEFFKSNKILADNCEAELIFESSGTTGPNTSRHYVASTSLYRENLLAGFESQYGSLKDYCILALLPGYSERSNSSLVFMVNEMMKKSNHPSQGYFLNDSDSLIKVLKELESTSQKTILLGVTHALLDLAEKFPMPLKHTLVMETGGMKGQRKAMVRDELHAYLCQRFALSTIHSEYGMTELLSQAYSNGNGIFTPISTMKIFIRDINDPFLCLQNGKTGGINVMDLANFYSCSFIATQDLGRSNVKGDFEVLGRFDDSQMRGCNLLSVPNSSI